jgi:hypothetical protein
MAVPLLAAAFIAAAGAGAAIAVTWDDAEPGRVLVATGGSQPPPAPAKTELASWPRGRDGWTITLASIPKGEGRPAAVERARQAKGRGLTVVGVIDSDEVAGVKPGYWVVFTGIYNTRPEATSDLLKARTIAKTAATRRLSG